MDLAYISLTGVPFLRGAAFFDDARFVVVAFFFLAAAFVDFFFEEDFALVFVDLAVDFLAFFLAFFFLGGTICYLLPWTMGASTRTVC